VGGGNHTKKKKRDSQQSSLEREKKRLDRADDLKGTCGGGRRGKRANIYAGMELVQGADPGTDRTWESSQKRPKKKRETKGRINGQKIVKREIAGERFWLSGDEGRHKKEGWRMEEF